MKNRIVGMLLIDVKAENDVAAHQTKELTKSSIKHSFNWLGVYRKGVGGNPIFLITLMSATIILVE